VVNRSGSRHGLLWHGVPWKSKPAGKREATQLGFSLLLKFYGRSGRFPRRRGELSDAAVAFVAQQVRVGRLA
jgi:hypothetical protein